MENIYFCMPSRVYCRRGSIETHLPELSRHGRKVFLVSGRNFIFSSGWFDRITAVLDRAGMEYAPYSGISPEPEVDEVEQGAALCREHGCDCVLAVGGGSAMDAGKAIAVLARNEGGLRNYFGEKEYARLPLPVAAIPTTCGTGSEVTRYAVIVDREERAKKTVSSESIIPVLSILDADILATLPPGLVTATGMDAFAHGAESFLSAKADALSRFFAWRSLELLYRHLPLSHSEPDNPEHREKLLLASMIAGLALNRTGTIILHGMGYSLTIKHNIHHGTANALLLPYVFGYLKEHGYSQEIGELEKIWGATSALADFVRNLGLPAGLAEIGVKSQEINSLAHLCVLNTQRSLKNMKIDMKQADFEEILSSA